MKTIAVVGNGKIGSSIYRSLKLNNFDARIGDIHYDGGENIVDHVDAEDEKSLGKWLSQGFDAVLCAAPFFLVKNVATVAASLGIPYFDLTEDRDATEYVKSLKSKSVLVSQSGLAPGSVSIITSDLIRDFNEVKSVEIRVGALPLFPNNSIQYYLSWSTNGLINEYCNLCQIIHNGKKMDVLPLEGYEKINIDGNNYEAFNTSGGIGSLCESLEGKVEFLNYKTVRYLGHHNLMKFLLDDLNLAKNRDLFIKLFDQEIPITTKDVVVILVKITGLIEGKLTEKTYYKKIYGTETDNAIQRTTVAGICGVMCSWFSGDWEKTSGFVKQEEIGWKNFIDNPWGEIYV